MMIKILRMRRKPSWTSQVFTASMSLRPRVCTFVSSYCKHSMCNDASSIQADVRSGDSTHHDTHQHTHTHCSNTPTDVSKDYKKRQHCCLFLCCSLELTWFLLTTKPFTTILNIFWSFFFCSAFRCIYKTTEKDASHCKNCCCVRSELISVPKWKRLLYSRGLTEKGGDTFML